MSNKLPTPALTRRTLLLGLALGLFHGPAWSRPARTLSMDVHLNGQGPYRFLLDTAAGRTALSASLAARLGLQPLGELRVAESTGAVIRPTVRIAELSAGPARRQDHELLLLPLPRLSGIDGIVGLDLLAGHRLELDWTSGSAAIAPATTRLPLLQGRRRADGLLVVPLRAGALRIQALVDTGADRSIGNLALLQAASSVAAATTEVVTATGGRFGAQLASIDGLSLAQRQLPRTELLFAELPAFSALGLAGRSAMILGSDLLAAAGTAAIDLRRQRLEFS